MGITRRRFIRDSGLATAYLMLPAWLSTDAHAAGAESGLLANLSTAVTAGPAPNPEVVHLINRITFGPRPGMVGYWASHGGAEAYLQRQLNPERIDDSELNSRLAQYTTLTKTNPELLAAYPNNGTPGPYVIVQELAAASMLRAAFSRRQLYEVMVDFWSNHLNIYGLKGKMKWFKTVDDREVIRRHALGKFRDMLLASARSPAMLVYLDNAENVKPGVRVGARIGNINENYAREVMELHTVGVDAGYTETDVRGVARALTGWTLGRPGATQPDEVGSPGEFKYVQRLHDATAKSIPFLGLTFPAGGGINEGETILAKLASHPKTARQIAYKLCLTFVSDTPPAALVDRIAKAYLANDTDIRATLGVLLRSAEFKAARGARVKLPVRALVSDIRALGVNVQDVTDVRPLLGRLNEMGQPFFGWAAPNGYPQVGAAWVHTSGMLSRWNAAFALCEGTLPGTKVDLKQFLPPSPFTAEQLVDTLGTKLLNAPFTAQTRTALIRYVGSSGQPLSQATVDQKLPDLVGLILGSPQFQVH